ncbi:kynureninase [Nitratireductor pacificus]|uniref:Kynureninase n=1 Tax=Nitratireductor pacificus pht-3B TaxID=391937 RepID=K2LJ41_9HYPH|nr:kynureninase [Nitratireductor pacificus]EKF17729.1 kynureninase [Nitratireductor pacificus pht-3B]
MPDATTVLEKDRQDPLKAFRERFVLPDGVIYLDGNSLGVLPAGMSRRIAEVVEREWGERLVRGWNDAGWIDLPARVAGKIARLVGAGDGTVAVGDSTSVNVFKTLSAALALRPDRRVILSDSNNFPTDLYIADGLARLIGQGYELRTAMAADMDDAIDASVAAVLLTEVDYRTGWRYDMAQTTRRIHAAGALAIWDLCHSAGAFPVHLEEADADFAIGCGYKYLNGGPGAPAFLYVAPRHLEGIRPALSGWMGHQAPFAFTADYAPAEGIARMTVGTPPVLSMSALDAALDAFDGVDMELVRAKSQDLCDLFIAEVEAHCPELELVTPRERSQRGSQVSFRHPEGYAIMQALIAEGVIGDFRAPDILRFGMTPLYLSHGDVARAAEILGRIMGEKRWDRPEFRTRAKVT